MSNLDSINSGKAMDEGGGAAEVETKKMVVKVDLYQVQEGQDKDGRPVEYIAIQLRNKENQTINVRQYLNKREDGSYKQHIYEGNAHEGGEILPSISWEIKELAKSFMGEKKYEAVKMNHGAKSDKGDYKLTRGVFENLMFEIDVKQIIKDNGETFLIPMFAYQRKKDAEYQAKRLDVNAIADTMDNTEMVKAAGIANDLPF